MKNKIKTNQSGIQTTIPIEFETYLQNKILENSHTDLNEIIFAKLDSIDLSKPIDRNQGLPEKETWVHVSPLASVGKSGENSVVYSAIVGGDVDEFEFNAIYLHDKNAPKSCGMIIYQRDEIKQAGMTITKSCIMQFNGAAESANVVVDAKTWQVDISDLFAACSKIGHTHTLAEVGGSNANLFINGDFSVCQRYDAGVKYSWGGGYFSDRWEFSGTSVTGGTMQLSWYSSARGYYASIVAAECTGRMAFYQHIPMEGYTLADISDKTITVSLVASTEMAGVLNCEAVFITTPNREILEGTSSVSTEVTPLVDGLSRYVFTLSTPNIPNINVAETKHVYLRIAFFLQTSDTVPACPDGSFNVFNAKCEWGDTATTFVPDLPSVNKAKCRWFYREGVFRFTTTGTSSYAGGGYSAPMRGTPAIQFGSSKGVMDGSFKSNAGVVVGVSSGGVFYETTSGMIYADAGLDRTPVSWLEAYVIADVEI